MTDLAFVGVQSELPLSEIVMQLVKIGVEMGFREQNVPCRSR